MSDTPPEETTDAPADAQESAVAVEEAPVETDDTRDPIVAQLKAHFGDAVVDTHVAKGDMWVRVTNDSWHDVVAYCKNVLNFRFFDFLSGLDWLNNTNLSGEKVWDADAAPGDITATAPGYTGGDTRFQVFCRLLNVPDTIGITLKVDVGDDAPAVATITDLFGGADWHERETWEMFGIDFTGHAGLRHLYLPGGFEGFPLRKDFPLLAREIKPWPGLVDKEPMPGEDAAGDEEEGGGE